MIYMSFEFSGVKRLRRCRNYHLWESSKNKDKRHTGIKSDSDVVDLQCKDPTPITIFVDDEKAYLFINRNDMKRSVLKNWKVKGMRVENCYNWWMRLKVIALTTN